jgi:hypothetical protein
LKNNQSSIGTQRESSLHKSLKSQYSGKGGITEPLVGSYICDAYTQGGELIEIQLGSFGPIKKKVKVLTKKDRLRIVHPIISEKQIELYCTEGQLIHRRKSPVKGSVWDIFEALVHAPEIPLVKKLCIELVVIDVVEKRINDGSGSWRRKGVRIADRLLTAQHNTIVLKKQEDYYQFIPFEKEELFTVKDMGGKAGIKPKLAQKALYVLAKMGLIKRTGKKGNAIVYQKS